MHVSSKILGAAALLASVAVAHPGESHSSSHMKRELMARDHAAAMGARSLNACSNSESALKMKARAVQRRADKLQELREKRKIKSKPKKYRRDLASLESWEKVNHNKTGIDSYDMFTDIETVFGANTSCVLAPETTDGPYYVVGEYLRSNVIESEFCDGVPLFLEVQYVDINTCQPVPTIAVDVWNCNATGVYAGVEATGQAGVNTTFLRGIQITDHDGVVQFETIFPGHYTGRATHTHLLAHMNASIQSNGTISVWNTPVTHIGQLYFPEDLITAVEALEPYTSNNVDRTTNDADMWAPVGTSSDYDPFPQFAYLGSDVSEGLFAWIQIGVNVSADYQNNEYYNVAAYVAEDGGHSTGSSIGGGSGGGGNGTFPGNSTSSAAPSASSAA